MMKSTKLSSWRNRNNSANISAILQPNYFQQQNHQSSTTTTLLKENTNKTSNFCYCRKLPNYGGNTGIVGDDDDDIPKLFQHPLEFYQNHQLNQQNYNDDHKNYNNNNDDDDDDDNDDDDDDDDDESPRKSLNLRLDLADFRESHRDSIKKSLNNHKSNDNHRYLNDLETWRRSHYFDTHSSNHLFEKQQQQQKQKQHTCIHRFKLNYRNLPVAINTDRHGLSCCIICNQPMRNYRIGCNNDDDKSPIYLQNDDDVEIQLVLNDNNDDNDSDDNGVLIRPTTIDYLDRQFERPVYSNTLALRYQRGVALP